MVELAKHRIKVTYRGGLADQNALPSYDGATSIDGVVRALQITTHAYMTGEVVSRATALRGASMLIKPARQGSFVFEVIAIIEQYPATSSAAVAVLGPPFYDFLKVALKRAVGFLDAEPENAHNRMLYRRREPALQRRLPVDLDELAETLEGSLQDVHRPIGPEGTIQTIEIGSSRNELVTFNTETKDWVNTREEALGIEDFRGNITRYNSISRNGRAYIDQFNRVIPVRPNGDFPAADLAQLTWSLHGSNIGAPSKLLVRARRVSSASGKVKRLMLSDCRRAPQEP